MKLFSFFDRAKSWLRTQGDRSALEMIRLAFRSTPGLSFVGQSNEAFEKARQLAKEKPCVLKSRRERLLVRLIIRELGRTKTSRYLIRSNKARAHQKILDLLVATMPYEKFLEAGHLYFSDCGISAESLWRFIELGEISKGLYRELKAVPDKLSDMLHEGQHRQQEYQRRIYDRLMDRVFDRKLEDAA